MLFCKDCRHFEKSKHKDITLSFCMKTKKDIVNVITGETIYDYPEESSKFCTVNRKYPHLCGMGAKWFEPKEDNG